MRLLATFLASVALVIVSGAATSVPTTVGSPTASSQILAAEGGVPLSGIMRVNTEFGDVAVRNAARVPGENGFFDVVGHGTASDLGGLSPSELAEQIKRAPGWGGQNVRLLSCSTGCPTGTFAQNLANELGVAVKAPTTDIFVNSRGVVRFDPGGEWETFLP